MEENQEADYNDISNIATNGGYRCSKCSKKCSEGMFLGGPGFTYLKPNEGMHLECYIEHVIEENIKNLCLE